MNKKIKALIGSVLAIAMSATVATGATFALFTDKAEVNVAITAGKVDVEASVANLKLYSMDREQPGMVFENLGTADYNSTENLITLTNITPGDKVVFDVNLSSLSNVKTKVRTVIADASDSLELMSGLKVKVNGAEVAIEGGMFTSGWTTVEPTGLAAGEDKMTVSIELPAEAGNEYQGKVAKLRVAIEAVQWNAEVESNETEKKVVINSKDEFLAFANAVNAGNAYAGWDVFLNTNIDMDGAAWTPIGYWDKTTNSSRGFRGTFDGQGYTVSDFVVNDESEAGLFGFAQGTIKNLNVVNADVTGAHWVGGIAGRNYGSITNCSVKDSVIRANVVDDNLNGDKVGGIVGQVMESSVPGYLIADNTVENVTILAGRDVGGIAGAVARANEADLQGNTVKNVDIYYSIDKSYEEAGEIISQRLAVAVPDNNIATDVTITKLTEGSTIVMNKADLLALSGKSVAGTIELIADIDMENSDFAPIRAYSAGLTFIGNGHTIKNINIVEAYHNSLYAYGMFFVATNGTLTVSDLVIDNATVNATRDNNGAAVLVGYADGNSTTNLINVDVKNSSVNNPYDEAAIYVSYATGVQNIDKCDITNCTIVAETDVKTGAFVGCANGTTAITNSTKDITLAWCNRIIKTLTVDGVDMN